MLLLRSKVVCVTEDARSADTRHWVSQHSVNTRWVSQRSVGPAGPRSVGRHSVGPNVRPHEGLRLGWSKHGQLDRDSSLARSGRSHGVISVTDHMSNANSRRSTRSTGQARSVRPVHVRLVDTPSVNNVSTLGPVIGRSKWTASRRQARLVETQTARDSSLGSLRTCRPRCDLCDRPHVEC
jgi:hypothetical protein